MSKSQFWSVKARSKICKYDNGFCSHQNTAKSPASSSFDQFTRSKTRFNPSNATFSLAVQIFRIMVRMIFVRMGMKVFLFWFFKELWLDQPGDFWDKAIVFRLFIWSEKTVRPNYEIQRAWTPNPSDRL